MKVLVIQTAFAGDLILSLPLIQEAGRLIPDAEVHVLCIPSTAPLLENHPSIHTTHIYDKRSAGLTGLWRIAQSLRDERYDLCFCPHRSIRSAFLAWFTGAATRVGFDRSSGRWLLNELVRYDQTAHEVQRNLSLLEALEYQPKPVSAPRLYPGSRDTASVGEVLKDIPGELPIVCVAPGSVWATKRWTIEGFIGLVKALKEEAAVCLIGGPDDADICSTIADAVPSERVLNLAGRLSFLASAALVGRSALVISNDSAPVHIASSMSTPVVEIYGATSPDFGFTPWQVQHRIVQRGDLDCKPCAIHGGDACPISTFECMRGLSPDAVISAALELLEEAE